MDSLTIDDHRPAAHAAELEEHQGEVDRLREVLVAYHALAAPGAHRDTRMTTAAATLAEVTDEALRTSGSIQEARTKLRRARQSVVTQIRQIREH
ncbi:hypothetical protein [Halorhodospira halophila]|uniref:hypothetical protein n=1 Tax=Halorhodospira halophila TaxID=1053 RepID=UPI0019129193|nr:hypothetical protein [Halorhodospira halophila]MBK5942746.1 hypothetical protein [Halorhodospira halophila]